MPHLYDNPPAAVAFSDGLQVPQNLLIEAIGHFEDFYEEVFVELARFGELAELHVCDNIGDHMIGNVYIKYHSETDAERAFKGLNGRFYAGKAIHIEYSPVTDFNESRCRLFKEGSCDRGGYCNFLHLKHLSKDLTREVRTMMYREHPEYKAQRRLRKSQE
jgi:splicing factor U2AF 35 kDa subunit